MEILTVLVFGLCFGSFITMASYRLPREESIWVKPSRCVKCEKKLSIAALVPVFSWVLSGGKCRNCKAKVSWRYPLTELMTAGVFVFLYQRYGLTVEGATLTMLAVMLLIMIIADFETKLIPDEVHIVLMPLGVFYHWQMGTEWSSVVGTSLFAGGIGLLLHYGYYYLRGFHALGFGDVKFLFVAGLWLAGLEALTPYLFYSGILGVLTGLIWRFISDDPRFPFGPALAIALFAVVLESEFVAYFWIMLGAILR